MQGAGSSRFAGPVSQELGGQAPVVRTVALVAICALATAVPTDRVVAVVLDADESFRPPSVYLSFAALLLSLPFLPRAGLGRRVLPILLLFGSVAAGILSLIALRWSGVSGGPLARLDRPIRLAGMSILFAFAASQGAWRRRLLASYLLGWAAFVGYGLYSLFSGRAEIVEHNEVARASIVGLDQNEQSVLIATGMVLLFEEMLVRRSFATFPVCLGAFLVGLVVFASGVSRSGTLALACGLAVVLVSWFRSGAARLSSRALKLTLVVVFLGGGTAMLAQRTELVRESIGGVVDRIESTLTQHDLGQRDELARRTWRIVLANPWHGVGLGQAREYLGADPHNGYLRILAEGGALAALPLLAGLALVAMSLARQMRRGREAGPAGALVTLLIWAAAGQAFVEAPFWFFLGVLSVAPGGEDT